MSRMLFRSPFLMVALFLTISGCASDDRGSAPKPGSEPQMIPMPAELLKKCRLSVVVRAACPTQIPRVERGTFQHVVAPPRAPAFFSAEWSAPYPKLSAKNAPPRFTHLVVHGEHRYMFPFKWPTDSAASRQAVEDKRRKVIFLGPREWAGIDGSLVLAPSYPFGGIDGDHYVFRWEEEGSLYAISLHAWRPLDESIATLQAIVESVPRAED